MRLVFHPKVYSDIDKIMAYYEEVATTQLAAEFRVSLLEQRLGRNRLRFASVTFGE